jgi:hypothetical protein
LQIRNRNEEQRRQHPQWSPVAKPRDDLSNTAAQRADQNLDLSGTLPQTQLMVRVAVTADRLGQPSDQPNEES